jgi:hypothetical protein
LNLSRAEVPTDVVNFDATKIAIKVMTSNVNDGAACIKN